MHEHYPLWVKYRNEFDNSSGEIQSWKNFRWFDPVSVEIPYNDNFHLLEILY